MEKINAQSSVEYLMIIALTLGIIVPTAYLFFSYGSESSIKIVDSQISRLGRNIVGTAESIYYSGESSKIILQANMPENIRNINILSNRELVFNLTTQFGESEAVFFSDINITSNNCIDTICSLSEIAGGGTRKIKFESVNNGKQVLISKSG